MITDLSTVPFILVTANDKIAPCVTDINNSEIIGLDIETTGLDCFKDKIRLIQIATDTHTYVIDFYSISQSEIETIGKALQQSKALKLFHNGKFDLKFLWLNGINIDDNIFDTFLVEQVIASGAYKNGFSLRDVAFKYLNITLDKTLQVSDWSKPLTSSQLRYSAIDPYVLKFVYQEQVKQLKELNLLDTAKLENQVLIPTIKLELAGFKLDKKSVRNLIMFLKEEKAELEEDLRILLPDIKNFNSPYQVRNALHKLGLNVESTKKDELVKYSDNYIEVEKLLAYKKAVKRISLVDGLKESQNPKTNRIHANYKQCATTTGRYSCSEPNLQGIPNTPEFRKCFVSDDDKSLIIGDYSQIELRIIAELADDKAMMAAFNNGEDIHKRTAALINNKPIEEVTKSERQSAKAMNFGLIYGMGYNKFKEYAKNNYGVELTDFEVREQVNKFFETYKGIADRLNILGSLFTLEERTAGDRRRLWLTMPIITERANAAVQGTGADILKRALIEINNHLLNKDIKLVATVHDEIVLEAPKDETEIIAFKLKELMEKAGQMYLKEVPVIAEVVIGSSWDSK